MPKKNKNEKLFEHLFSFSCEQLQSMQITKVSGQTDIYSIVIPGVFIHNNLTENDINYILELGFPKYEKICERSNKNLSELMMKTIFIVKAFLNTGC